MARPRFSLAGLMGVVLVLALGLASLRFASETSSGVIVLMTLGILSLTVLGVVYRRGAARAWCLGFALLGWGYMVLASESWWDRTIHRPALVTSALLDRLYPILYVGDDPVISPDPLNKAIVAKLDEPISMAFANETPLEDVLKYVKSATTGPNDNGIPIYVDPSALRKAGITMTSPVMLDLEGVPLKSSLRLLLAQIGLAYEVKNGLLTAVAASGPPEAFRRIGHCFCALLAAWIGGIAGWYLYATRDEAAERDVPPSP